MREITVNINGTGGMALFQAAHGPLAGHDIVVTSGEDGVVYLTDLTTERVASETVVCDGAVPACAVTPEQTHLLVVQDEENALYSYVMPSSSSSAPEIDKLLFRSTVAIRHVACSQKFVAVADEEATVKVLLRAASDQVIVASGHGQGVKSVAIDPSEQFLCSSSEDGTVRVFELQADERMAAVERAVFTVQYKDMRDDEVLCRCAWQRGECARLLAVPVNQGVVELFDRSAGWASAGQLLLPSSAGKSGVSDVNVLAFSPNGLYVAGATLAKQLVIWSVATKDVLRSFAVEYAVLGVEWAASQNALVAFHAGGKLAFVKDVVPLGRTPPQVLASASVSSGSAVGDKAASMSVTRQSATTTTTATTAAKKRKKAGVASFVDDEAAVDGDASGTDARETDEEDETETRVEAIKASFGFGRAAAEAAAVADATLLDDDDNIGDTHDGRRSADNGRRAVASVFRPHLEPFQPGSVQGDGSAVCLLVWTPVGEIETVRGAASGSSTQENVVTVAFADKARRGFKFSDKYLFSMAALGDTGAFFGVPRRARDDAWDDDDVDSDQNDDAVRSSFVFYRPFEAWAPNSSWHAELPAGEDAECVAAGADFCAVATSLHCLRVYTAGGVAYALARLPGRVVTMCARGSRLAVVYQNDACGDSGALAFQLLKVRVGAAAQRVTLLATGRVPLSPPPVDVRATAAENAATRADPRRWATLTWLGLDDRLVLYAVDSRGCVLTLSASVGWNWFPVGCVGGSYNSSNAALPSVFPLGVVNDTLLYVPLEPGARVPRLRGKHRPVPLAFALRTASFPPSTALSSSKKQKRSAATDPATGAAVNVLWQNVRLCALEAAADEQDDSAGERERDAVQEQAEMDKALILMMKAACASDEPARVLDLAKCLHLAKSHQIAQKLAVHFGLRQLQSELFQLYVHMFEGPSSSSSSSKALLSRRVAPQHEAANAEQDDDNEKRSRGDNSDAHETTTQETTQEPPPSAFFAKASRTGAAAAADATAKPVVVERSVAPANPFRKSAGEEEKPGAAAAGLRRLAKFASPPPAKKRKPGK
ncbi:hypothetical protein PybrP1_001390 [[Pythium] brassicae (nom. inval.)]|nr:hypothetical protein PybrP1_001390 [[Pythium] brassicae (nom. inval.)]